MSTMTIGLVINLDLILHLEALWLDLCLKRCMLGTIEWIQVSQTFGALDFIYWEYQWPSS